MKCAIYLRVSTLEQDPEKQKNECVEFATKKGYDIKEIFLEQLSGYKDIDRPKYEEVKDLAKKGEIQAVICWALDRWVRNRDTLLYDVTSLRSYGCKLHSVRESYLEAINIEGPLGKTIQEFLLGIIGSLGEIESKHKSERVKMAFKSHTGKKWGRPDVFNKVNEEIIKLHKEGLSIRQIKSKVQYWDKNNNQKNVSIGTVHKCIAEFNRKNQ